MKNILITNMKKLKIVQINIRSANSNKTLLEKFMLDNEIDIASLSETWFNHNTNFNLKDYKTYFNSRPDGYGGVGFLIKNEISVKIINKNNNTQRLEFMEIEIIIERLKMNLISFYNSSNRSVREISEEFELFLENYKDNNLTIIMGDINAHHNLWEENRRNDSLGIRIADIITASNLCILNNGKHTRKDERTNTTYAVDITLATNDISSQLAWECIHESIGSDHYPIVIETNHNVNMNKTISKVNWKQVKIELNNFNPKHTFSLEDFEENIEEIIKNNTKHIKMDPRKIPKPWWTEKIQRLYEIKKQKELLYKNKNDLYTAIEFKKAMAKLKLEIKKIKKQKWNEYINDINPQTCSKDIWQKINKIHKQNKEKFNLIDNKNTAKQFLDINFPNKIIEENMPFNPNKLKRFENEFDYNEICEVIQNSKNTAPGSDRISYKLWKEMDYKYIETFTDHFNKVWQQFYYPEKWKESIIKPIKKPNKDEQVIANYRGIALQNVDLKIINKLIQKRLENQILINKSQPNRQYGFRKGYSIQDYFVDLLTEIQNGKNKKMKMAIVSIDLSKAFDLVNNKILIEDLKKENVDANIINWIYLFLINRKVTLKTKEGDVSNITNMGVPQGSALSPILFNIYTRIIHTLESEHIKIYQFADDISILITQNSENKLIKTIENLIRDLNRILSEKNLQINLNKTQYMKIFSKNLIKSTININGTSIIECNRMKMLGITITNHLSLVSHYKIKKQETQKNLNLLKIFTHKYGGAHPGTMMNIFKSLIKTKISFAYEITNHKTKSITNIIQQIKNNGIRTCLGLTKTTPVPALLAEAGEKTAELDIIEKTLKYIARKINKNSKIGNDIKNNKSLDTLNRLVQEYSFIKNMATQKFINKTENLQVNINLNKQSKKEFNQTEIKLALKEELNKYHDYEKIYTDGSKKDNICAIGIYYPKKEIEMGAKLINEVSIKTTECIAIKEALQFAIANQINNVLIMTDSMSTCISIKKTEIKNSGKYYENTILDIASKNPKTKIIIMWIPAHIDIHGNEMADKIAKSMLNTGDEVIISNLIPIEDINKVIEHKLYLKWNDIYSDMTKEKGEYNSSINNNKPPKNKWYTKHKELNSQQIKLINRLRTNHSYNKYYKFLIKIEQSPNCDTCNTIENNEHLVINCKKYETIRNNFPLLANTSLKEILKNNQIEHIKQLIQFLNSANISI